uniref:alpha-1,2-Mannosidase n=1 Tax=Petromyzon marinus TaxID=7757 RepID=A0AAJ7U672_PETMA|nr:ER degradation-enhancing alpha-mannosidase-like protein 3 isoform X2 [Petromyzon marinus]
MMTTTIITTATIILIIIPGVMTLDSDSSSTLSAEEKSRLREQVLEMFDHAYGSYMTRAFPDDELMPLSCRGRDREREPSRGDADDALGRFSLTLIDSLDTLVVLDRLEEFDRAVRKVLSTVRLDSDIVVSVFEANIRALGGLLGGHVMAAMLRGKGGGHMAWYRDELLLMASELGRRLLPAFNTSSGLPHPRVNLAHGVAGGESGAGAEEATCTACAGSFILEFAALSRLTGEPEFEERARRALDFLWERRERSSDLVGTVINIHTGEWVRRDSGVGAGIDSYYEYLLKAYVLLGDEELLLRFNAHYASIMRWVSQPPLLLDVHMHEPEVAARGWMDALLAFFPGLQVLKGDLRPAIETHEMLYQLTQRHHFLPEAFTTELHVHWPQHPLRPEFAESTYFLYKVRPEFAESTYFLFKVRPEFTESTYFLYKVRPEFAESTYFLYKVRPEFAESTYFLFKVRPEFAESTYFLYKVRPEFAESTYFLFKVRPEFTESTYFLFKVRPEFAESTYFLFKVRPEFAESTYFLFKVRPEFAESTYFLFKVRPEFAESTYFLFKVRPEFAESNYFLYKVRPEFTESTYFLFKVRPEFAESTYFLYKVRPEFAESTYFLYKVRPEFAESTYFLYEVRPEFAESTYFLYEVRPEFAESTYFLFKVRPEFAESTYFLYKVRPEFAESTYFLYKVRPEFAESTYFLYEVRPEFAESTYFLFKVRPEFAESTYFLYEVRPEFAESTYFLYEVRPEFAESTYFLFKVRPEFAESTYFLYEVRPEFAESTYFLFKVRPEFAESTYFLFKVRPEFAESTYFLYEVRPEFAESTYFLFKVRPEFAESTYFLYKATGDPHYLEVGRSIVDNLNAHARVPCGFAGVRDVRTGTHEDRMDSYFLAETFKYLYLLFTDDADVPFDLGAFVFTTEAHLLPLGLPPLRGRLRRDRWGHGGPAKGRRGQRAAGNDTEATWHGGGPAWTCPNVRETLPGGDDFAGAIRRSYRNLHGGGGRDGAPPSDGHSSPPAAMAEGPGPPSAAGFDPGSVQQLEALRRMGIALEGLPDGRMQLHHNERRAESGRLAEDGARFMRDMAEHRRFTPARAVQLVSPPFLGRVVLSAAPAQFGLDLAKEQHGVKGSLALSDPPLACSPLSNGAAVASRVVLVRRGECTFAEKARNLRHAGARGGIVIDDTMGSSSDTAAPFQMAADGAGVEELSALPLVFVFQREGAVLTRALGGARNVEVLLTVRARALADLREDFLDEEEEEGDGQSEREEEEEEEEKPQHH